MIAVGLMSGTSADGIEAAAIAFEDARPRPRVRLLAHRHSDYAPTLREAVLAAASGQATSARDLALLHAALGDAYAAAACTLVAALEVRPALVALHGQTVAHHPAERATLQLGDASRVAAATGVIAIADFRSADISAGGEGAPLVPFADHLLFADGAPRALLNLGGIANLTLLP
ncbi:MAG: anhydro-N-acetylmuramic acid kinase, partial [Candidatus Limnocylindria bacterium]